MLLRELRFCAKILGCNHNFLWQGGSVVSWRSIILLGTGAAIGIWMALPDEKKVKIAQKWIAIKYNLADVKDGAYIKARLLSQKLNVKAEKADALFVAEGFALVFSEYAQMARRQLGSLLDEIRLRIRAGLQAGEQAYRLKKAELQSLSSSVKAG